MTPLAKVIADAQAELERAGFADDPLWEQRRRREPLLEVAAQLPESMRSCKAGELLRRVHVPAMREAVRAWRWGSAGLVLLGSTGAGKSSAAAWLVRRLCAEAWRDGSGFDAATRIVWVRAADVAEAVRQHPLGRGAPDIIRACERASLLVVDDGGWDADPRPVSQILDARYNAQRPTVLTSGMKPDALAAHYSPAVIRRVLEGSGKRATIVQAWDHDWLQTGAA